jgi:hypothetical protein
MYYTAFGAFVCVSVGLAVSLASRFAFPAQGYVSLNLVAWPCQRCTHRQPEDDLEPVDGNESALLALSSAGSKTATTVSFVRSGTGGGSEEVEFSSLKRVRRKSGVSVSTEPLFEVGNGRLSPSKTSESQNRRY